MDFRETEMSGMDYALDQNRDRWRAREHGNELPVSIKW
jgi:hypothetical protein